MTAPSESADRRESLALEEVRQRLADAKGPQYWRSLEEVAETPEFRELVEREFPRQAAEWPEGFSRRRFLELSAASMAMAGLTACTRQPAERIVPYIRQPEELVPGKPLFYATAFELGGYGTGVLAEAHMGRPTKLEGNPDHPQSLGATDLFAQASILDLYDPDRSQVVRHLDRISTWEELFAALGAKMTVLGALGGAGLHIVTGAVTSPTLAGQLAELTGRFPNARWHRWEPAGRGPATEASREAFGQPVHTRHDFEKADVIVTLDADPLASGPGSLLAARQFARRRKVAGQDAATATMNRLYSVESSPTKTASLADHRLALPPSEVHAFAAALATELAVPGAASVGKISHPQGERWVRALAADLAAHRGSSLVVAGETAPSEVHVLAQAINQALGNFGTTVLQTEPVEAAPDAGAESLTELVTSLDAGEVDTLVLIDVNPVYDAPADLDFTAAMQKAGTRIHLGRYFETAEYCQWHVPAAHYLESWGDTRSDDGTVSLIQPLIEPLFGGKTAIELVSLIAGENLPALDLVQRHWQTAGLPALEGDPAGGFEKAWRKALHDGLIPGTAAAPIGVQVATSAVSDACAAAEKASGDSLELVFRPDPTIYDGRFANNGWLQEIPKPLATLTWDNALLVSPGTASERGLATEDLVEIRVGERSLTAPVWVMPGHANGCATLTLGYGRQRAGRVGDGAGVDAYRLRTSEALWVQTGATITAAGGTYPLASTQEHHSIDLQSREAEARHLVRHGTLDKYRKDPEFVSHIGHGAPGPEDSLFPPYEYPGHAWGLAVDLSACTGCQACVVACQSENTIPVVGKDQVKAGREMHWIRIDRYYEGDLDEPDTHHQPVMCMHCEQAPCEVVCPVSATVHSFEGLNDMVYNRCVGTRYCSNNCPYKVRRFNFFNYSKTDSELVAMARNPDVTVRFRGVMEKCTYCVQRINHARIDAKREQRKIADGEIKTACQQACPSEAIVFGDTNDPDSEVSRWKSSSLNYGLLEELGTRPRTTYLAKLSNPNPELAPAGGAHGDSHSTDGDHHG